MRETKQDTCIIQCKESYKKRAIKTAIYGLKEQIGEFDALLKGTSVMRRSPSKGHTD